MLTFSAVVSGGQVAYELANDEEELAEMLKGLAGYEPRQLGLVSDYLYGEEQDAVVAFLRSFADSIESPE